MYIYKVGVVGAGMMGAQIAEVMSYAGLPVVLADINEALVKRGLESVRAIYQSRVDKGKMTAEQLVEKMLLVTGSAGLDDLKEVDLVIEAVSEDAKLKAQVFHELDQICPRSTILASNTSALSISALGASTTRPDKVLGLHFFNPAYVMRLVEVVPGLATATQTLDDAVGFTESIGKLPIVVKECAGFLVNRVLMAYVNEAVRALQEGAATLQEIDQEMVSFGMPVGPLALLDAVGLDISYEVARILYRSYGPRMTPAPLLEAMLKAGRIGVKCGHGFYDYVGEEGGRDQEMEHLLQAVRPNTDQGVTRWSRSRLLSAMTNEAVTALQEGVASAGDIDLAMVAGIGYPKDKEGPLHFADQLGIDQVLHELEDFAQTLGPRFWPAPMLRRMVDAGFTGRIAGRGFFTY
ncbi:MAG: 3-hydroxybutyryl-CoA dehydrogenase [Nitrospira sp.]|jgi:3-hydroxyacyl-CoA dehydrogenase|nr:MAG: 3-hydroxybutyryl-CoA dehydrogenase [Nitrospira sp.]